VELDEDLVRVLAGSDVRICLDTGHLAIGGTDVVALAEGFADRVGHVHLKDVHLDVADRFRRRELDLVEATRQGLFRALGDGDVPVAETIQALESGGYDGWYVLEQDTTLDPEEAEGTRPLEDAGRSITFLHRSLAEREEGDSID
jgi:inosose dehydratase